MSPTFQRSIDWLNKLLNSRKFSRWFSISCFSFLICSLLPSRRMVLRAGILAIHSRNIFLSVARGRIRIPARNVFSQTGKWVQAIIRNFFPWLISFLLRLISSLRLQDAELTLEIKKELEDYWKPIIRDIKHRPGRLGKKYYVLSMFPYPSGKLHLGKAVLCWLTIWFRMSLRLLFYSVNRNDWLIDGVGWDGMSSIHSFTCWLIDWFICLFIDQSLDWLIDRLADPVFADN